MAAEFVDTKKFIIENRRIFTAKCKKESCTDTTGPMMQHTDAGTTMGRISRFSFGGAKSFKLLVLCLTSLSSQCLRYR